MKRALFKSHNLLGDGLYIGPAALQWYKLHGHEYDEIHLHTLPSYVAPIYEGMGIPWKVVYEPEGAYDFAFDFNVSQGFDLSIKRGRHLAQSYADMLKVDLPADTDHRRPNYRPPILDVPEEHKGLVLVSMFSMSCESRGKPARRPNKMLPWEKWRPLLDVLMREYPGNKLRLLGAKEDRVPDAAGLPISEQNYLTGVPIPQLANIMMQARCLVTVDNGMGHLAASVGLNEFLLAPACLPLHFIVPKGHPGLRLVHIDPVEADPAWISAELSSAIRDWKKQEAGSAFKQDEGLSATAA